MFKWLALFLIALSCCILALKPKYSRNIDLANLNPKEKAYLAPFENKINHSGFNSAPEIGEVIQSLAKEFEIENAVETGTFLGGTTNFLSACFDEVHTIEIVEENMHKAQEHLKNKDNIYYHLGSSETVLKEILPNLEGKRTLFYLDAHWNEYWPLLDELEEIAKTHKDNCVIVIDDFKVPKRRDIPFDQYGEHQCSYKYIQKKLDLVFSYYDYYYLIPKDLGSRAKFVAFPKQWPMTKGHLFNPKLQFAWQTKN